MSFQNIYIGAKIAIQVLKEITELKNLLLNMLRKVLCNEPHKISYCNFPIVVLFKLVLK